MTLDVNTRLEPDYVRYRRLAQGIRIKALQMVHRAGSSHVGTTLSMADLLAVLYGGVLRVSPTTTEDPSRDRFVLSKGHGSAGVYAVLALCGFFPPEWLDAFNQDGTMLSGHIAHKGVPGVEVSTGALGHGLSIAAGMALAGKLNRREYRVFALLSDGECDEGSTWEAALFASHHCLDNLVSVIDYNKIQSLGTVDRVLRLEPFGAKWQSFGWEVKEIDGHSHEEIHAALIQIPFNPGRPSCVIAHTVKGKGVSFMENKLLWHYRCPDLHEFSAAMAELGND